MAKTSGSIRLLIEYIIIKILNVCLLAFSLCLWIDFFLPTQDHIQVVDNSYLYYSQSSRGRSNRPIGRMLRTEDYLFDVWKNAYHVFPPGDTVIIAATPIMDTPRAITNHTQGIPKHELPFGVYAYFMFFPVILLLLSGASVFITNKHLSNVIGGIAILFSIWVASVMNFF